MDSVGVIVTARVRSSRLKDKVLQTIRDKTTIEILLGNLTRQKLYPVILAIPDSPDDAVLDAIGKKSGVDVYRGNPDSPLLRLCECAEEYGFTHVVRITADDILIDATLLTVQVQFALRGGLDYCYMGRCPEGVAGEVIRTECLRRVVDEQKKPIEFIGYYLKVAGMKVKEYYPPREYQHPFRLTMDYPEDLMLLRIIFGWLPDPVGTLDIINFLRKNKYLLTINHLPRVTVYTVNYNYGKYLVDTIRSVCRQTFPDWEYIVYDDGSTDDSVNVAVEYMSTLPQEIRKRITLLRGDHAGLPAGCNKVLTLARGKYVVRLDSDDILGDNAIEILYNNIEAGEDTACVFSGFYEFDDGGRTLRRVDKNPFHPAGCILSRKIVNEMKYRDGVEIGEGTEFFARFMKIYRWASIPTILWGYRRHAGQKTEGRDV